MNVVFKEAGRRMHAVGKQTMVAFILACVWLSSNPTEYFFFSELLLECVRKPINGGKLAAIIF